MNHHMHDYARRLHAERIDTRLPEMPVDESTAPLRSLVGNALIRAGTRLLPRAPEPRRVQTSPPC
ncbi:MAG: hypothetical protein QNJ88_03855 [Acidimicrobiia bacterium]|nr:hypothetical protein [Acidimicrobiia bacterium]